MGWKQQQQQQPQKRRIDWQLYRHHFSSFLFYIYLSSPTIKEVLTKKEYPSFYFALDVSIIVSFLLCTVHVHRHRRVLWNTVSHLGLFQSNKIILLHQDSRIINIGCHLEVCEGIMFKKASYDISYFWDILDMPNNIVS